MAMPTVPADTTTIKVYTDGACSGNPGPGGWAALMYLPDHHVQEIGGYHPQTTNNQMELEALLQALFFLQSIPGHLEIHSDSKYVLDGIQKWIWNWKKKGWRTAAGTPVANRAIWEQLAAAVEDRGGLNQFTWIYVPGHSGNFGNDRVDELAVRFSKGQNPSLYKGPLHQYPFH